MSEKQQESYRVLARKYRPQNFDQLIGQDVLVRTLCNAIESGRIAHAFMLTGVRGTGKTTTARLIAKALNYTGKDGKAEPTTGATDDCDVCRAITEDRHPDVIEMDAASRTGVDDIREILDGVRYAPTSARYKIYIIDEVHMLSKQAFNALLKTLEEPPEHVKFIFATTEIRKVPVTVLSRCQRFDLRRIDVPTLTDYYKQICEWEKVKAEDEAISLIARTADGSVRDGMSLLDQAMALSGKEITGQQVQDMLGLADRMRVMDILEHSLKGECPEALAIMDDLYRSGSDPVVLMQDMLDFCHVLTRLRAVPQSEDSRGTLSPGASERAARLSLELSMPTLGRAWQILLKGIGEVNMAPDPQRAAEMVIIRLNYAADLPDPARLLKKLQNQPANSTETPVPVLSTPVPTPQPEPVAQKIAVGGGGAAMAQPQAVEDTQPESVEKIETFEDILALLRQQKEGILEGQIYHYVHLIKMTQGTLEIRPEAEADPSLVQNLQRFLANYTGQQWMVTVSDTPGQPTMAEQDQLKNRALLEEAGEHPVVKGVMAAFPGSELKVVDIEKNEEG